MSGYQLFVGDCIESLSKMEDQSVNCCVTSPPYYGLRDYGVDGQIGLEESQDDFIDRLVAVFRQVRRVLRDDGTLWINMGDSYASRPNGVGSVRRIPQLPDSVKVKDMLGIPWMLAFALRSDGWYLRQDIIWHKPNPMPESVRDRCTKAHEYIFLLSKSPRYFFDHEAMKEPAIGNAPGNRQHRGAAEYEDGDEHHRTKSGFIAYAERVRSKRDSFKRDGSKREQVIPGQTVGTHRPDRDESAWDTDMRNRRDVWSVATRGFSGAHFATFPPALIEPCILAGCPVGGTVLDPFAGSGTTAGVAVAHDRHAVLCELNNSYASMTPRRVEEIVAMYGKQRANVA